MVLRKGAEALLSVTEKFSQAQGLEELSDAFKSLVARLGGFYLAAGLFVPTAGPQKNIVAIHYPEQWVSYYFERGYIEIDPTIHMMSNSLTAYDWSMLRNLNTRQQLLFDEVRSVGVKSGLTVPIHLPDRSTFVTSFANLEDWSSELRPLLIFIATALYERYISILKLDAREVIRLSARERECLTWVACGKSSWDIGAILNISENTVNFHLKNAFAKLGGKGRILCVVRAIMLGLISP